MADFASAAMLQVMAAGLRRAGISPTPGSAPRQGARVTLQAKRELAGVALQRGGWALLPQLGQGVHELPPSALHQAFLGAAEPRELLQRWQRLERFVHSRHRVVVLQATPQSLDLEHRSLQAGEPPLPVEDLLVQGLLVALAERIGALGVQAWCGSARVWPEPDGAALAHAATTRCTARWSLRWEAMQPQGAGGAGVGAASADTPIAAALALLHADPMAPWPLPRLAARLGLSPRSWQRRLAAAGLSHGVLLLRARCEAAARLLVQGDEPLAAIGFACGFADQAHFTRRFQNEVGLTPGRYRASFAATPPAPQRAAR